MTCSTQRNEVITNLFEHNNLLFKIKILEIKKLLYLVFILISFLRTFNLY